MYRVKLIEKVKFANGHELSASDVVFSFNRQLTIKHPSGPSILLNNLREVKAVDDMTIDFYMKTPDSAFPRVLASPAAHIVDEETFSANSILDDESI